MYCGKCSCYIPEDPHVTACFQCGTEVREALRIRTEIDKLSTEDRRRIERRYDYLEALFYSFFSKYFYRDMFRRWKGGGVLFLAFATAVWLIPYSLGEQHRFSQKIKENVAPIIDQMPRTKVSEGRISYEGESHYIIREVKSEQIVVYLTSDEQADLSGVPALFLIKPTQVTMRELNGSVRTFPVPSALNFIVTPKIVHYWIRQFERWCNYFLFPFLWLSAWAMILFVALFYALIGKFLAFLMKVQANFQSLYRLAVVAFAPLLLIDGILAIWSDQNNGFSNWIDVLGPIFFIALGLWFNREPEQKAAVPIAV